MVKYVKVRTEPADGKVMDSETGVQDVIIGRMIEDGWEYIDTFVCSDFTVRMRFGLLPSTAAEPSKPLPVEQPKQQGPRPVSQKPGKK